MQTTIQTQYPHLWWAKCQCLSQIIFSIETLSLSLQNWVWAPPHREISPQVSAHKRTKVSSLRRTNTSKTTGTRAGVRLTVVVQWSSKDLSSATRGSNKVIRDRCVINCRCMDVKRREPRISPATAQTSVLNKRTTEETKSKWQATDTVTETQTEH